jgi:DNA polymerase alpha subunit A
LANEEIIAHGQVLKGLVERRKQVKGWLKKTTDILKYQQFDIQQQALKLTANRYLPNKSPV